MEQGLPSVGTLRDLTGVPARLYVRLSALPDSFFFLMMKAMNYKIGTEVPSDGVCPIQNQYFRKLQYWVKGITCPGVTARQRPTFG